MSTITRARPAPFMTKQFEFSPAAIKSMRDLSIMADLHGGIVLTPDQMRVIADAFEEFCSMPGDNDDVWLEAKA